MSCHFVLLNWIFFLFGLTGGTGVQVGVCSETLKNSLSYCSCHKNIVSRSLCLTEGKKKKKKNLMQQIRSQFPPRIVCTDECASWQCVLKSFVCARSREFRKLTYPARCFLDLSEMPSRDMSLLNTTIPISIFT